MDMTGNGFWLQLGRESFYAAQDNVAHLLELADGLIHAKSGSDAVGNWLEYWDKTATSVAVLIHKVGSAGCD